MMKQLKKNFENISFFKWLARKKWSHRKKKVFYDWLENKKPLPMPHYGKQKTLLKYANDYDLKIMVETGTYKGDMVYAVQPYFEKIYSIELGMDLYNKALERLSMFKNVQLIHGDSGNLLPKIIKNINQPCLFWLDAHYSSGKSTSKANLNTPIIGELMHILTHPIAEEHVILIDDARDFTGKNGYPTLEEIKQMILKVLPKWVFEVKDDIIRAHSSLI